MDYKKFEQMQKENPFMPLSDIVYELILQEIISFRLAPGTRITESGIAQELRVSRSPVKTALEHLAEKKLVKVQNSRYFVSEFDEQEYKEISDFTMLVEPYCTAQAAKNIAPEQLDELFRLARELREIYQEAYHSGENYSYTRILETEMDFHFGIIKASGNQLITKLCEERKYELWRYRGCLLYSRPEGFFETIDTDHVLICEMLKMGDSDLAAAVSRRHLHVSREGIDRYELLNK